MQQAPYLLHPGDPDKTFPDVGLALREPDGLLAIGGDLSSDRILAAYRRGIFPWFGEGQPILWWSPDPRTVIYPDQLKISRSLRKVLRRGQFRVTFDQDFEQVVHHCAAPRRGSSGTWITAEMAEAYIRLFEQGYAHSIETREGDRLVGGLYGLSIGRVFFGESMFSLVTDASKVAFAHLLRQLHAWDFGLVDCQVYSEHLASLGAAEIPRSRFVRQLRSQCEEPGHRGPWVPDPAVSALDW